MTRLHLKYVHRFRDRHGAMRFYFRRHGKRTPLPGLPGTTEFVSLYQSLLDSAAAPLHDIGASRTRPGTIADLVARYFDSQHFRSLADGSRRTYRGIVEQYRVDHGVQPVAALRAEHIKALVSKPGLTAVASNHRLRIWRVLLNFAVDEKLRADNPALAVKRAKVSGDGYHTWTEGEIAAYEAQWPVGTVERLAMALPLYTALRLSDVVRLGRQHLRNGVLSVRPKKGGAGADLLDIPLHPDLAAILDATPTGELTFLVAERGKPFTDLNFSRFMRAACDAAGLPHCTTHGLRKGACRRLAEAGCTPHQIMAITGHKTLKEIERYAEKYNRSRAAVEGMAKIPRTPRGKLK